MSRRESQYVDIVDEFRTRAYIDGRNAARDLKPNECPPEYQSDSLAELNWLTGYDDFKLEREHDQDYVERFSVERFSL